MNKTTEVIYKFTIKEILDALNIELSVEKFNNWDIDKDDNLEISFRTVDKNE